MLDSREAPKKAAPKAASKSSIQKWDQGSGAARNDTPAPAKTGREDTIWSSLMLHDKMDPIVKPNGDLHHIVEPALKMDMVPAVEGSQLNKYLNVRPVTNLLDNVMKEQADVKKQAEQSRTKRTEILGLNADHPESIENSEKYTTQAMSLNDYNALTPKQRAAVDFNTMLSTAVQHDRDRQDDYKKTANADERATYGLAEHRLFGDDRGSDVFAPETVAVLSKLNLKDKIADLDDYLSLKVAVTTDDLKMLDDSNTGKLLSGRAQMAGGLTGADPKPEVADSRFEFANNSAIQTQRLQQVMAKGNNLLQTLGATVQRDLRGDIGRLGGEPDVAETMLGYGDSDVDKYFQSGYEALANTKSPFSTKQVMDDLHKQLSADEINSFLTYADTRSRNAELNKTELGNASGAKYRTADEFRDMLGLGK